MAGSLEETSLVYLETFTKPVRGLLNQEKVSWSSLSSCLTVEVLVYVAVGFENFQRRSKDAAKKDKESESKQGMYS